MDNKYVSIIEKCKAECAKRLVGQEALVSDILTAFVADGHVLLEGNKSDIGSRHGVIF